jgi:hypothetical protein
MTIREEGRAPGTRVLELHVTELKSLFHALDPAPFRERDLDPRAQDFIVEWAREQPLGTPLGLSVRVDRGGSAEESAVLQQAVREFFRACALSERRRLRQLLRRGRISLGIGLAFVALASVIADLAGGTQYGIIRESAVIGGWVALWRPLEIFLYDWWPIRAEARLYDRLAEMPVELVAARTLRV